MSKTIRPCQEAGLKGIFFVEKTVYINLAGVLLAPTKVSLRIMYIHQKDLHFIQTEEPN